MTKDEIKKLRALLQKKREQLIGNYDSLQEEALSNGGRSFSNMPVHLADLGSDNYEQDVNLGLMQNERTQLREIEDALARIDDGTYGVCEGCDKKIPKARLKALPFVRNCIQCQRENEKGMF